MYTHRCSAIRSSDAVWPGEEEAPPVVTVKKARVILVCL